MARVPILYGGERYPDRVLRDGAIGYWRMNATSGTTELDRSGNGHDGTYSGSPTLAQTGALSDGDTAIKCANTGRMTVSSAVFNTTAFSIAVWVQFTATDITNGTASEVFMATQQTFPTSGWRFGMHKFGGDTANHFAFWCTQEGGTLKVESVEVPVADTWYHVVITYDGTTYKLYVNGAFSASGTGTRVNDTSSVIFGYVTAGEYLDGYLDECATYNVALSAAQIAKQYALASQGDVTTGALSAGRYRCRTTIAATTLNDDVAAKPAVLAIQHRDSTNDGDTPLEQTLVTVRLNTTGVILQAYAVEANDRITVVPYSDLVGVAVATSLNVEALP